MSISFIWLMDRSLSGITTPGESGPGSNSNKGFSVFSAPDYNEYVESLREHDSLVMSKLFNVEKVW